MIDPMTTEPNDSPEWGTYAPSTSVAWLIGLARHSPLGRGIARRLIYNAINRQHPDPIDTRIWGTRVRLHHRINVSERKSLLRPDLLDPAELRLIREALTHPGAVFVDVGSNAGLYALNVALNADAGTRIVAIEPSPDLISRLSYNLDRAREDGLIDPAVRLDRLNIAVSDTDGTGTLSIAGGEGNRGLVDGEKGIEVPVRRLSAALSDISITTIDAMKIDVEGHEDHVLPPYLDDTSPEAWPRLIVLEHLSRADWSIDVIADCERRGYRIERSIRNNTILRRTASIA